VKYRKLGRAGVKVSEISLGSYFSYGSVVEKETAFKTIDKAYELGVNFFDSANVYDFGVAEQVLGEALAKYDRSSYVLATKVFFPMGDKPNDRGLSRKHIMEQAEGSLKRLNTDYLDIYYCHRFDTETPLEESLRALDDLMRQGKIMYVGVSEWTSAQIEKAIRIADHYLLDRIVVNQPQYSLLNRIVENDVFATSEAYGIGQVVFQPIAQGVLSGKYRSIHDFPTGSRITNDKINMHIKRYFRQETIDKVLKLIEMADGLGITTAQLALAWVLRKEIVSSALIGASSPKQIEENVKASGVKLPADILAELDELFTETI